MKILKLKFLVFILAIYSISFAANALTAIGTTVARIATPLVISITTPLQFGSFASSATSGTIKESGVTTGGVTAVSGPVRSAGVFNVTGESSASMPYALTFPSSVSLTGPGTSMTATLALASGTTSRTLSSGADTITINGTLSVAANQASGNYSGTYSITANY